MTMSGIIGIVYIAITLGSWHVILCRNGFTLIRYIPVGCSPNFLSSGIKLHPNNVSVDNDISSVVQSFFVTLENVLHKVFELLPN